MNTGFLFGQVTCRDGPVKNDSANVDRLGGDLAIPAIKVPIADNDREIFARANFFVLPPPKGSLSWW